MDATSKVFDEGLSSTAYRASPKRKTGPSAPLPRVSAVGKSDQPSRRDSLDRKIYVTALAALIQNPRTQAPLTIGIYGPWGSGKSSFLAQLTTTLPRHYVVANFNPWRLTNSGEVWAGMVAEIAPIVDRNLGLGQRLRFILRTSDPTRSTSKFRTRLTAFSKKISNWLTLATGAAGLIAADQVRKLNAPPVVEDALTYAASLPWVGTAADWFYRWSLNGNIDKLVGWGGAIVLIGFFAHKIRDTVRRPFSTQFQANLMQFKESSRDLKDATFKDFEALRKAIGDFSATRTRKNKPPLVLLIDDLDRCSPERVVAVLEAVNHFIAELPIITVFAIDTKFVCNAVAAQHRFLFAGLPDDPDAREKYGRLFLEKIIHIPFQLPAARSYTRYVEDLLTTSTSAAEPAAEKEKVRLMPSLDETLEERTGLKRIYARLLYLYLFVFVRTMRTARDVDQRWMWSVVVRLALGLDLTEDQRDWLASKDYDEQIQVNMMEQESRGRLLMPLRMRLTMERAKQEALSTAIKIEEHDRAILRGHTANLRGNPRSIKRFVNTYLLAKGINTIETQRKSEEDMLTNLAAWLVLLQNWPRAASTLCAAALAHTPGESFFQQDLSKQISLQGAPADLLAFVQSRRHELEGLLSSPCGLDIARCFSFFTTEA